MTEGWSQLTSNPRQSGVVATLRNHRSSRTRVKSRALAGAPRHELALSVARDPGRLHDDVRQARPADRRPKGHASGGAGVRVKRHRRRHSLSSGRTQHRGAVWVPVGREAQARPARSRSGVSRRGIPRGVVSASGGRKRVCEAGHTPTSARTRWRQLTAASWIGLRLDSSRAPRRDTRPASP